jgi:large subunit ribosomal protein L35
MERLDMPKIKTHRGAAKRFSMTGTGKVKRSKAYASHILTTKTKKRKRNLRKSAILDDTNEKAIKKLLPYL